MSLDGLLLEKLAKWRPDGRQALEVKDSDSHFDAIVTADAVDVVGCRLWELSLRRADQSKPETDLKTRAETIVGRVSGLLETLALIELDASRDAALLRSATPGRRGDAISYYELLLEGNGSTTMRRYEGPHGEETRRQQIPYTLTHDSLGKLVSDLTI
jgi:hypothetical protein